MFDVTYNNYNNYGNHMGFGHVDDSGKAKEAQGTRGAEGPKETSGNGNAVTFSEMRQNLKVAMQIPEIKSGYNFTQQEREVKYTSLAEKLQHARGATAGGKSILFDMYALMALIQEVSQKMRDAMREMRKAENTTMYANIKAQAAIQREAAVCAMITGAVMCGVQGAIMIGSMAAQFHGMAKQSGLGKLSGETMANEQAAMTAKGHDSVAAQNQLDTLKNKLPENVTGNKALNENTVQTDAKVDSAHNQLEVSQLKEKVNTADAKVAEAQKNFNANDAEATKVLENRKQTAETQLKDAQREYDQASAEYDNVSKKDNATIKEISNAQSKKLAALDKLSNAEKAFKDVVNGDPVLSAQNKLETASGNCTRAQNAQTNAQNQLTKANEGVTNAQNDLVQAREELAKAQNGVNEAQGKLTQAEQKLASVQDAKNNLDVASGKLKGAKTNLENAEKAWNDADAAFQNETQPIDQRQQQLRGELESAKQTLAEAQGNVDRAIAENRQPSQQDVKNIFDSKQKISVAESELAKCDGEYEAVVGKHKDTLTKANNDLKNANTELDTAQNNFNLAEEKFNAVKGNNSLEQLNIDVNNARNDFQLAKGDLKTANYELETANNKLTRANENLTKANENLTEANNRVTSANKELETAQADVKRLTGEVNYDKTGSDYVKAIKDNGDANQELAQAKELLSQRETELNGIDKETDPVRYDQALKNVKDAKLAVTEAEGKVAASDRLLARYEPGKAQTRLDAANQKLTDAQKNLDAAKSELEAAQKLQPPNEEAVAKAQNKVANAEKAVNTASEDVTIAKGELARAELFQAQAEQAEAKAVFNGRDLKGANPDMSVNDAQKNYNAVVGAEDDAKGFNTEAENMTKHNAGLRDVENCQKVYDAERGKLVDMKEQLEIGTKTDQNGNVVSLSKEEIAQLKADIEVGEQNLGKAENNLRYARALQVKHSADLKLAPGEYANVHRSCDQAAGASSKNLGNKHIANNPQKTMQAAMLTQQLGQILGNFSQQVVQGIKEIMTSKATELQADQKLTEDQLDQIKDLMSQYLTMIQKVIDLFSSVIQKESQTIEEILRA